MTADRVVPEAFDSRPSILLDNLMPENPKIVGLSDAAFRLYIEALCWSSRQQTDGKIPAPAMARLGRPKTINELITAELFYSHDNHIEIHDYLAHQRSRAEIQAFRAGQKQRGAFGAHMRWHVATRKRSEDCDYCTGETPMPDG